jgi:murein DD-endopeptidase MepM/ murein hydrolase activator NlpD
MGLSPELQQQARNVRGAWDLATAGGRENLQLMQRIATEMAGLLHQQNGLNRGRAGRSIAFEAGRRGQERITDLSRMQGADPDKIRRLRSQATNVIYTGNTIGDIAGSREAARRMNASISRYTRELNAAAASLRAAMSRGGPSLPIRGGAQVAGSPAYMDRLARLGGPRESISGRKDLVGSPAYYEEQQRQLQRAINRGGPRESVKGRKDLPGSPAYVEAQRKEADRVARLQARDNERALREQQAERNRIARLRQIASPIRGTATMIGSPAYLDAQARAQKAGQPVGSRGPASPIGGTKTMVGSPAYLAEQKRQQGQRAFFQGDARSAIGDALIGGAFPALFGQGLGASAGGAAGGLVGGLAGGNFGFGLSLIGTAIGQAVDTTVNNLTELADAIRSPSKALDALEKSGLASSRGLEQTRLYVDQLTAVGRSYDAQTLVLQEVQKRLGPGSLTELGKLDTAQQKVQEQFGAIASEIQVRLLPVLQGFVEFLGNAAGDISGFSSQSRLERTDSKRFEQLRSQATRDSSRFAVSVAGVQLGFGGDKKKYEARLSELSKQELAKRFANERAQVPQTPQEKLAGEMAQIQESRKIADQIQSAYREAFSLQRQAYDLQRDGAKLNKDIADYSYKKEREIFDLRQQAAEKQIENNRARAQNRIESSDLNARQTFAAAVGFEQQLLTNVREVVRSRKEGEADIEQSRNRLELAMAKLNRDVEDYKRTNAREIEDIEQRKLSYVRSVEDYKMKVADHVLQRAREAADLMRQAMTLPDMGAATAAPGGSARTGVVGGVGNMLPGTKGGPNINEGVGYGRGRLHAGRDLGLDVGDPIHARRAGTVTQSYSSGFGKVGGAVVIRYDDGTQGTYGHTTPGVRQGQKVEAGQRIATVTTDPNPRNTHLHYELRDQLGKLLEPLAYVLASIRAPAGAASNIQGQTATQISNIPGPKFSPVPIGTTPSVAPINAANMAARLQLAGGEKEALKILEEQNKLKQKGIELGQIEQILQANQLPQLKQQEDTLKQQIEARQRILDLSDNAASVADIEAESKSRLKQIELDRVSALASAKKKYGDDPAIAKQINFQAGKATEIAKNEEKQRRINLDLNNKLQNQERARSAILQLQETLATGKAEAAALERGKLQASNVELLKASELYQLASEAEKTKLALLTAQTEELSKQNEFRKRINEIRNEARFTGAGLRAGMIGAPARAFEEEMKRSGNIDRATGLANETKLLENQQLVWGNLEKNIVATSDAISGALTNGLVSIADGSRKIEDVGRDMLRAISSSFADSAQQQLTTLLQRQMGGLFQAIASQGLLSGLGGAGAGGLGGGLGAALSGSLGNIGSAFSVPTFGGFMAKGGITKPGEVYVTGEKEPEFFFPGVTGRVVPRSDMQKAEALRNSGNESDSLDISYTVREERGERYVTEDQLRKSNAMVERRAFAKTINGMKNNGALRDSINI